MAPAGALRRVIPSRLRRRLRRAILSRQFRGDAVECPCCGGHFREFMPFKRRRNVICPRCALHDRHRAMWLYLHERTNLFSGESLRVLHFAPEELMRERLRAQPGLDYLSADLESPLADVHFDITDIPYGDDSFDVILCSHVLEHVDDDRKAMRELARILRPTGWALLLSPIDYRREETYEDPAIVEPEQRRRAYWQEDHMRLYGRDFPARIEEAGFDVTEDPWVAELDDETVRRHGLRRYLMYIARPHGAT